MTRAFHVLCDKGWRRKSLPNSFDTPFARRLSTPSLYYLHSFLQFVRNVACTLSSSSRDVRYLVSYRPHLRIAQSYYCKIALPRATLSLMTWIVQMPTTSFSCHLNPVCLHTWWSTLMKLWPQLSLTNFDSLFRHNSGAQTGWGAAPDNNNDKNDRVRI